jgi:hypothetical protein
MSLSKNVKPGARQIGCVKPVDIKGSFAVAGGAYTAGSERGPGWTGARTGAGVYTVTLDEKCRRPVFYGAYLSGTAALMATMTEDAASGAQVFTIRTFSDAGAATDITGRVSFVIRSEEMNAPIR